MKTLDNEAEKFARSIIQRTLHISDTKDPITILKLNLMQVNNSSRSFFSVIFRA